MKQPFAKRRINGRTLSIRCLLDNSHGFVYSTRGGSTLGRTMGVVKNDELDLHKFTKHFKEASQFRGWYQTRDGWYTPVTKSTNLNVLEKLRGFFHGHRLEVVVDDRIPESHREPSTLPMTNGSTITFIEFGEEEVTEVANYTIQYFDGSVDPHIFFES